MTRKLFLLLLLMVTVVQASDAVSGVQIANKGVLVAAGVRIEILHFSAGWKMVSQSANMRQDVVKKGATDTVVNGVFEAPSGVLTVQETITPLKSTDSEEGCTVCYTIKGAAAVPTEMAVVDMSLPIADFASSTIDIDGKPFSFPLKFEKLQLGIPSSAKMISIPTANGLLVIKGNGLNLLLQDNRKYNGNTYSLRFVMDLPPDKKLLQSTLSMEIFVLPNPVLPTAQE